MSDDSIATTNTDQNNEPKLSPVELIKDASIYLRGTIGSELLSDSNHFGKDDLQLLKFHGTYQQDDREQHNQQYIYRHRNSLCFISPREPMRDQRLERK